jgi:hypothetical protein
MTFAASSFPVVVPQPQLDAFDAIWSWLAQPGGWWTGEQKIAAASHARTAEARPLWDRRPSTIDGLGATAAEGEPLSPLVVDTIERIAVEAGSIERTWAEAVIAILGDAAYAELVSVVASVVPIDRACALLGRPIEPLPDPAAGEPSGERAAETVGIGSYLPVQVGFDGANVAKSLSVAPTANMMRLGLVRALYSGTRFGELKWDDGPLNRPQVELVAARTSALNECFY